MSHRVSAGIKKYRSCVELYKKAFSSHSKSGSAKTAKEIFDDRIIHTSVPPTHSDEIIGNYEAEWDDRRCVFVRDNVIVEIQLPSVDVKQKASIMDHALLEGGTGIIRGVKIDIPILDGLEYDVSGWKAIVIPKVAGYTSLVDDLGNDTRSEHVATKVFFVSEVCVMAEPLKCDITLLSAKREEWKMKKTSDVQITLNVQQQAKEAIATLQDHTTTLYSRNKAVVTLGNAGDIKVVPILLKELAEGIDPVVKQNTIVALGRLRAKQAVPALLKLLEAPRAGNVSDEGEWEAIYCRQAANALGAIGDPLALAILKKIQDAPYEYQSVREAARGAILKIDKTESR